MKNCSDNKIVQIIRNVYPDLAINFYKETMLGTINVFTALFETEVQLKEFWEDLYSTIAAYFQTALTVEEDFEKWNIYIFYICRESVDRGLHYRIENDRYACRKIVIGECDEAISDRFVSRLTAQHITNLDLLLPDSRKEKPALFEKNELINTVLTLAGISSQKKYTETDLEKALKEMEGRLK